MLFSKNLRKLALGLVVAAAAALGFAAPASADVFYDASSTTTNHAAGWLVGEPREWTALQEISLNLSGSDFAALTGFSTGFLTFTGTPTGPTTLPSFPMTHTFSIYSGQGGTGTLLLSGTGTSNLVRTSSTSVSWIGEPQLFTSALIPSEMGIFELNFTLSNASIPATGTFPQFVTFAVAGSFTTSPAPSPVPEPSTFALLTLGGLGLGVRAYRRRKAVVA